MRGRMKLSGLTRNLTNESIELCEKTLGQGRAAFLFVILQDRTQIFPNEPVKDQRH